VPADEGKDRQDQIRHAASHAGIIGKPVARGQRRFSPG
jgi:hypothetical protein